MKLRNGIRHIRVILTGALFCLLILLVMTPAIIADSAPSRAFGDQDYFGQDGDFCQATQIFYSKYPELAANKAACGINGQCDVATTRDAWIPDAGDPITYLRLIFHILRNDDGSNAAASEATIISQVAELNKDYLPSRIQFTYSWNYINSTQYRSLSDSEMDPMKMAYAITPSTHLNVFVSYVEGGYSFGTFPWDPDATTARGGIVMTTGHFQGSLSVLAHETGHCIGLWHTHHGVSEVGQCSSCYERADGLEGDQTGDYCSDTRPTPTNYSCSDPGGTDPCSGVPWAPTDTDNFMGYSGSSCWNVFSPQQRGRIYCWLSDALSGWVCGSGVDSDGDLVDDECDNCPNLANPTQADWDVDGEGDPCDSCTDRDGDGYGDPGYTIAACPSPNIVDNCPDITNADQADADADNVGDVCDNCPNTYNPNQWDGNGDGIGDMCDGMMHLVSYDIPDAYLGASYYYEFEVINGVPPYNWEMIGGDIPFGLTFTGGATGTLTGTPSWKAIYYFTVVVTDSDSPAASDTLGVTVTVTDLPYICGDADGNGLVNITDAVALVNWIFSGGPAPDPLEAADADCDGIENITDAAYLITFIFNGGPAPCSSCP